MKRTLLSCAIGVTALPQIANAQAGAPLEAELDVETVIVVAPLSDADSSVDVEPVLGELSLNGNVERVLENGVRLRARSALRLQADHPSRPGGTGGFGDDFIAPVGSFSGLSTGQPISDSDLRARLETAYLQIDGGYGELRVGKDQGVAARFHEGSRSVLSHARLDSSLIDPTGLTGVRTRHDLTGPSLKVSYATPRLLGIRAGASFTPEADADGLDRRPNAGTSGITPNTENAFEIALNATRRLRESGWRFDAGLGWSTANVETHGPLDFYNSVETWSAGTRLEKDDWTIGLSWLESDNGRTGSDYKAWSAGLHKEAYNTDFSIEFGESEDKGAALDSQSWRVGAAREFGRSTQVAIAYLHDEMHSPFENRDAQGIVVEITLSQQIAEITGN
jgi:predicted porin